MKKWLPYILLATGILAFYYLRYKTAPDIDFSTIEALDIQGQPVRISDIQTEKTIVHFYATWCGPCMAEAREIRDNSDALKTAGITILFVTDDSQEKTQAFSALMPSDMQFIRISSLQDIGIQSIPTSYFISNGRITDKIVNALHWENINHIQEHFQK